MNKKHMTEIIIYTKDYCPYCVKIKEYLKRKGHEFIQEIDITHDEKLQAEMIEKSGGKRTVPQVFINGIHTGGCDDTIALDKEGKLEELLNKKAG